MAISRAIRINSHITHLQWPPAITKSVQKAFSARDFYRSAEAAKTAFVFAPRDIIICMACAICRKVSFIKKEEQLISTAYFLLSGMA